MNRDDARLIASVVADVGVGEAALELGLDEDTVREAARRGSRDRSWND